MTLPQRAGSRRVLRSRVLGAVSVQAPARCGRVRGGRRQLGWETYPDRRHLADGGLLEDRPIQRR
jgi:hypothetical protein